MGTRDFGRFTRTLWGDRGGGGVGHRNSHCLDKTQQRKPLFHVCILCECDITLDAPAHLHAAVKLTIAWSYHDKRHDSIWEALELFDYDYIKVFKNTYKNSVSKVKLEKRGDEARREAKSKEESDKVDQTNHILERARQKKKHRQTLRAMVRRYKACCWQLAGKGKRNKAGGHCRPWAFATLKKSSGHCRSLGRVGETPSVNLPERRLNRDWRVIEIHCAARRPPPAARPAPASARPVL
ncbi:hypothetical protein EVAR_43132_1 [Eumeta japonica]|uniref:Uncharacterized protein n=1 Tax=Eumeta variegata TaxID=151549 RepID=A0A4C1XS31_EUMVA|nr:hypothetical protein EVAR_43132_1 [Eumeta japonica]